MKSAKKNKEKEYSSDEFQEGQSEEKVEGADVCMRNRKQRKFVGIVQKEYVSNDDLVIKEKLVISYSSDYNIVDLDKRIQKTLEVNTKKKEDNVNKKLQSIEEEYLVVCDIFRLRDLASLKESALKEREKILKNKILSDYNKQTSDIISAYSSLSSGSYISRSNARRKEDLVNKYLEISSKFIDMSIERIREEEEEVDECPLCKTSLSEVQISISGLKTCPNPTCCLEEKIYRPVTVPPKEYDTWNNLLKEHKRFMGAAPTNINIEKVMADLDGYFVKKGRPPGKHYRSLPCNEEGEKEGTCHQDIYLALKELKYVQYYKYHRYLCMMYYGWVLPDLSYLVETMEKNYRAKQEVWKQLNIKERGGKSTISTPFRLCMEYQHAGCKISLSKFKITGKKKTINRYIKSYSRLCNLAGYTFPHYVCDKALTDEDFYLEGLYGDF